MRIIADPHAAWQRPQRRPLAVFRMGPTNAIFRPVLGDTPCSCSTARSTATTAG